MRGVGPRPKDVPDGGDPELSAERVDRGSQHSIENEKVYESIEERARDDREPPWEERRVIGCADSDWLEIDGDERDMVCFMDQVCTEGLPLSNDDGVRQKIAGQSLIHRPDGGYDDTSGEYPEGSIGIPKVWVVDDLGVVLRRTKTDKVYACLGDDTLEVGTCDEGNVVSTAKERTGYRDEGVDVASAAKGHKKDIESGHWVVPKLGRPSLSCLTDRA